MLLSQPTLRVAQCSHLLLMACVAIRDPSVLSAVLAGILLMPLRGILQGRTYTCAWASMMIAFYAAAYLADGYAQPDGRITAFLIAAVGVTEFAALVLFVKFSAKERLVANSMASQATESSAPAAGSDGVSP